MAKNRYYAILVLLRQDAFKADNLDVRFEKGVIGYLPVYESREIAEKEWPEESPCVIVPREGE